MHTISARGHSRLSVVGGVRVCFHCALFLCSGDSDVLKIKIRSGAQRGASSSVDSNDDGYKNLVRSDEREQMSHPDGGGALIALSASQSRHAGLLMASISSATPFLVNR